MRLRSKRKLNRWQKGWETRWEHAYELGDEAKLGPKGQEYIWRKYGDEVRPEEPPDGDLDEMDYYDMEAQYP